VDRQRLLNRIYVFIVLFAFGFVYLISEQKFFKQKIIIVSPLPNFLTSFKNDQVTTLNLWFPSLIHAESKKDDLVKPEISAKSALVYDLTINKILFEKNPTEKLSLASLTKMMTAIIALENYKADDRLKVRKEDLVGENSMGLSKGEVLTLSELLYGLILPSGNDAAEVLASNYPGGRLEFIKAMNNKSKSFGLYSTNFTNPSGLEGDGEQYSTAYDLLIMTRYTMQFDLFRQVVSTVDYYIPPTQLHKEFQLYNETNLLTSYPGVKGVKTGYTPEAGLCLVTYLDYEDHEIIGIILGSSKRREEMKELLDYSLKIQDITPPPHE
jgi:D-alanyl-D-alanine carboxypeptidase (penicillin-binding protein 5/6)